MNEQTSNMKPADALCRLDGLYYKIGRLGFVFRFQPGDGWLKSAKTVKELKSRINQLEAR